MVQQNESVKKLDVGKDYICVDDNNFIVIDRTGDIENRGFYDVLYKKHLDCSNHSEWREATEQEVIAAFKRHLIHRYGEDWKTMKIKERHPSLSSAAVINNGLWNVEIYKEFDGWNVCNKNGLLYCNGIWVERLEEEEEPKIHIKEAIKENTAVHCETEEEAERILRMTHTLGYKWWNGDEYEANDTEWDIYKSKMCYYLFDGSYSDYNYFKNRNYSIIPSTQIADLEPTKSSDWVLAPEEMKKEKAIEKLPIDKVTTRNLDIALRSKSLAPHRCPVCNGSGLVPNGFYMQTGGHWSTTSITPETCRSCGGTGIVWG